MSAKEMELVTYSKCACANCGHAIEFASWQAGKVVTCPSCKEQSILPEPEKLLIMDLCGPPAPEFKKCPACSTQMQFWAQVCPACESARKTKALIWRISAAMITLVVLAVAGVVGFKMFNHHLEVAREKADIAAHTIPSGSKILIEQPRPQSPKSLNDLRPGKFYLEQRRGSDLMLAVGDISNDSDNLHRGLRADVDVLDRSGAKIGSVNDFFTELPAHQSWHFVATITEPNAVSVRFVGIKEDQQ